MIKNISKIISTILIAFVLWRISDVLIEFAYDSIDRAIESSNGNVSGLLLATRSIVGLLAFDGTSFAIITIVALISIYKTIRD
jgi:cell shape-determining protein MreC